MKIGFTGTRIGMTDWQRRAFLRLLEHYSRQDIHLDGIEILHGCCVGSDAQVHELALKVGCPVHGYPADHPLRDLTLDGFATLAEPAAPLDRNRVIVERSDLMIAAPASGNIRGGTWRTIRLAVELGKLVHVLGRRL